MRAHDVRFVEDNWASPALGAWGLGWEVWLDGLEITQFTYFQQAGGMTLDPVSVEITYGMERILMALQGVRHFKDIAYAPGITYGEVFGQAEYEMCRYYLDDADVADNRALLEAYAAEAQRMIDARPARPGALLRAEVLARVQRAGRPRRGVTTERAARSPGCGASPATSPSCGSSAARSWATRSGTRRATRRGARRRPRVPGDQPGRSTLVFEIGVEEMPPAEVPRRAASRCERALTERLAAARLSHGAIRVATRTPRRIIAIVERRRRPGAGRRAGGAAARASRAAYDADGTPTKAAAGLRPRPGRRRRRRWHGRRSTACEYVALRPHRSPAARRPRCWRTCWPQIVSGLRSAKNMRWNDPGLSFTRPIRWLLALLGRPGGPGRRLGLAAGRTTRVHRTAAEPTVESRRRGVPGPCCASTAS